MVNTNLLAKKMIDEAVVALEETKADATPKEEIITVRTLSE